MAKFGLEPLSLFLFYSLTLSLFSHPSVCLALLETVQVLAAGLFSLHSSMEQLSCSHYSSLHSSLIEALL